MHNGLTRHEIGRNLADLYTIGHQADMIGLHVAAALFYAISVQSRLAFMAAFPARLNAILHDFIVHHHDFSPFLNGFLLFTNLPHVLWFRLMGNKALFP